MATPSLAMIPSGYKDGKVYSMLPANGDGDFTFSRGSNATRVNKDGLIETVTGDTPRLDYTDSSCPSLLLEPQSTNLLPYSEDFSNAAWDYQNVTVNSNQTIAPDGTLTADKITDNSTNGSHRIVDGTTTSSSGSFTYSIFLKKGTLTTAQIQVFNSETASSANVDLVNGTITSDGAGVNHTIQNYGNDWFRCSISGTLSDTATTVYLYIKQKPSYIGNGDYLYAWGAQLEELSYTTSYIPTNGAIATRLADVCSNTSAGSAIGQTEGTIFLDVKLTNLDGDQRIAISDGTATNRIALRMSGTTIQLSVVIGSSTQASISGSVSDGDRYKIAGAYKENYFVIYINGVLANSDNSGSISGTFNRIGMDRGTDGANVFYNPITNFQLYKTALTHEELQALTS